MITDPGRQKGLQRVSMVLEKKKNTEKSLSTSSSSAQLVPVDAGGTPWQIQKKVVFGSKHVVLNVLTKTLGCRKGEPTSSRHDKSCDEEDGLCSCAKFKVLIAADMANMKDVSP